MSDLVLLETPPPGELILWREEVAAARAFIRASRAGSTRHAYTADWRAFERWAAARGETVTLPCPVALVVLHLSWMATNGAAASSIGRRAAAIAYQHRTAALASPTEAREVREAMAGIRRTLGVRPRQQKAAATADILSAMLAGIPKDTLAGKRDRALLSLG